jgi:hypothetical protein
MEEWIRNPIKQVQNGSIIWKAINFIFHLVGNWFLWQVGKGDRLEIGLDPWVGYRGRHRLSPQLILEL